MLERFPSEGIAPKLTSIGPATRVDQAYMTDLGLSDTHDGASAPLAGAPRPPADPHPLSVPAQAMGKIRDEFEVIARSEQSRKTLDMILAKIRPGYKALMDNIEAPAQVRDAENALVDLAGLQSQFSSSSHDPGAAPYPDAASSSGDKAGFIEKIEAALRVLEDLRGKLSDDSAGAHQRLLNIGALVNGPKMGGMRVGDDFAPGQSASDACELIVTHVRSVIVAHARLSPHMAKLILG